MKTSMAPHSITAAVTFFLVAVWVSPNLNAQATVRVNIPGAAFTPERGSPPIAIDDVPGGRRFRGKMFARVRLVGQIRLPPAAEAKPNIAGLVVNFRTSPSGPSLRSVDLLNGSSPVFQIPVHLAGDYTTKAATQPKEIANAWVVRDQYSIRAYSMIRLEVIFPGGFDSVVNPGEFVLAAVGVDFPRNP